MDAHAPTQSAADRFPSLPSGAGPVLVSGAGLPPAATEQRSRVSERRAAEGAAGGAGPGGDAGAGAAGGGASVYLESKTKDCDRGILQGLELRPCRCRSWFCPDCCCGRGLSLRERLRAVLQTFTGLQMWTFTVDPTLFPTPEAAFDYLKANRCLARLIRSLRRQEVLHSRRFFCVVEWQHQTEMPHFHVMLDASFIEFDLVCQEWNAFRPAEAGPVVGDRPGFGAVRFSASKHRFHCPLHAANYACKYLIKHPERGYPAWVLNRTGQIHRYSVSSGFWKSAPSTVEPEVSALPNSKSVRTRKRQKKRTPPAPATIGQRIAKCGQSSVLLAVKTQVRLGSPPVVRCEFVEGFGVSVETLAECVGRTPEPNGRLPVNPQELIRLKQAGFSQSQSFSVSPLLKGNHG